MTNIRWDRESPDIKIIDWNVVASEGAVSEESIQRDLNRLASYLFWLRTLVRPPDRGASPRVLSRLGGTAWSEQTSLAFRLVLERALDPDPAERYGLAYDFEEFKEAQQSLFSLGDLRSLGAALDLVAGWYHNKLGEILALAGRYKEKGLATESLALIELGRKNLDQESDKTRKQFQDYFDELEKEIIAGANRPSFDRGKRYLEGRNATAAVEQFEQAVKDTPDDLEAHRWLALARSLSSLKLDPLREVWASGKLQKAMHALAIQDWDEALKKLQVPDLDLKALQIDARVGQALSAAEVLATSKAGVAELLDKLDEVERLTNEHPSHPYIELVLQQWPRWKSWREQAMSMSHEESVSDDLRTRLQQAFATDFTKAVRLFRQELSTRPADSTLLSIGLDESQKFLKAGKPEQAIVILRTALSYVGSSSHFASLRRHQEIAEAWLNLRVLVPREDWDSALQQAAILDSAPREIQQKAVWEMKQILEQPDNKFPPTPRGTGDMSDMSGDSIEQNREPTERLSALIREAQTKAEEKRIQEERERRQRIVQQIAELEGQDTLESLRTAQQVTDGLLKSIPTDDPEYASVEETRQRLKNRIQQKEVESKRQEALQQAHGEEEKGDRLSTHMDRKKLEQAIEHYQKAAEWFRKADDETSADRAAARQEEIKRILDQLPDLSADLDKAAELLNRLETALELLDLGEEARRSLNLEEACALIAQVNQVHPQASRAQELTAKARTIARRLGWSESKFQALIQPPRLDWAERVVAAPPPPPSAEEDERARWLRRIGAALSDLGDRDISQVLHKDAVDRAKAWQRQVLTDIFDAWKDGDMQAA
ncbi:MAG TPA: hypothetical protein ENI90_03850, partial [Methylothermaceae bacterium]|nr:hypothetical protein [Methylothermaceae bacterium]